MIDLKQKIIAGILLIILISGVGYYVYSKENSDLVIEQTSFETNKTNETNDNKTTEDDKIFVHISGAVNKEGLIELPINSRVSDAIEKADGIKEDANLKNINLAYKLEDGMKIYIPNNLEQEQIDKNNEENIVQETESKNYIIDSKQNEYVDNKSNGKVNINTANQTQLETLPGIGESTALKIIDYRLKNGRFKTIEDIKEVSGIGNAKYEKIKELITV